METVSNQRFRQKYKLLQETQDRINTIRQHEAWRAEPLSNAEVALKNELQEIKEFMKQALLKAVAKESPFGLLHSLMSEDEIEIARDLVKRGLLQKGIADTRERGTAYFLL